MGVRVSNAPPIGTYELGSQFKKDEHTGFNFGSGRNVRFEVYIGNGVEWTV